MGKQQKLTKLAAIGTAVAAAALALSACGGSAGHTDDDQAGADGAENGEDPGRHPDDRGGPAGGPNYIFPMMGGAYFSVANFQLLYLLYRPLYWFGVGNTPDFNESLSVADAPVYSNHSRTVTIKMKGYKWSNGESVNAQDVVFWMNMLKANATSYAAYIPGPGQLPGDVSNVVANSKTDTVTFTLDATYSSYWFTYNELSQLSPLPIAWDITSPSAKAGSGGCSSASYTSIKTSFNAKGAARRRLSVRQGVRGRLLLPHGQERGGRSRHVCQQPPLGDRGRAVQAQRVRRHRQRGDAGSQPHVLRAGEVLARQARAGAVHDGRL